MENVPLVMRTIRSEMRGRVSSDLSVPQFRALSYVRRYPGTSLSDVAEHVGLTLPSISKMIDRLEARNFVQRSGAPEDRRRICLDLTPLGQETLARASAATREHLAQQLAALTSDERAVIIQAMSNLRKVFGAEAVELAELVTENDSDH